MDLLCRYQPTSPETSARRCTEIIDWSRSYASRRMNSRLMDERRALLPNLLLDFGNRGVLGITIDEQYDGLALRCPDWGRVLVQLGAIDLTVGDLVNVCIGPGERSLVSSGSPELKSRYLPDMARGRIVGAYGQTESAAGSNFQSLRARADQIGPDGWRLNGEKIFIGNASWSAVITAFAYVYVDGQKRGLTAFAVPTDAPGVVLGYEIMTSGLRCAVQNQVAFRDVRVTRADIIGELDQGLEVAVDSMNFTRLGLSLSALGGMKRCLQLAHRFASRREINTGLLADNAVTLSILTRMLAKSVVSERLLFRMLDRLDQGRGVPMETVAIAKLLVSEFASQTADDCIQVLGGRGYDEANLAPQFWRDARVHRIFEGSTEPLLVFVGQRALMPTCGLYDDLEERIGRKLRTALAALMVRPLNNVPGLAGLDARQQQQWKQYLSGTAAAWACALSATVAAGHASDRFARDWAETAFEAALLACEEGSGESVLTAKAFAELTRKHLLSIGDVEQLLPGEQHLLDPLLRKHWDGQYQS